MVVAKANPKLKIINQDRAPVIEHAKAVSLLFGFRFIIFTSHSSIVLDKAVAELRRVGQG